MSFNHERKVCCQRHLAESGNEDGFGLVCRRSNHIIRTLHEECKQTRLQQEVQHVFAIHCVSVHSTKFFVTLLLIGFNHDIEQFSTLATNNGDYFPAYGRYKLDAFCRFVNEKSIARLDMLTFFH